ncbi:acetyl-CoA carboxylase biotin carboxyl carrier protein [Candidatus Chloroploca sp. Khr17]|uniref:acetyl-CoA carboxylase biotin carboxyl carrier protein n=1 Tax=Candidatus Chloroploca sp. Khr17 TaxID=2496869 RepID=UPI00101C4826|nr:acetyl-CoA carboxylase biotin carboxyl carrier protein [Candidatus Chloroploca sp. Khr17]
MSDVPIETATAETDLYGLSAVRELLSMIDKSDVTEILIERGEIKLHIKRGTVITTAQPMTMAPMIQPSYMPGPIPAMPMPSAFTPEEPQPTEMPAGHTITAPMVGTFYASPSPKDAAFVQEGDELRAGDPIGIIEAMKMMNEIESDIAGRVARILVKNGQPVEYGQALMIIEPL